MDTSKLCIACLEISQRQTGSNTTESLYVYRKEGHCKISIHFTSFEMNATPSGLDFTPADASKIREDAPIIVVLHGLTGGESFALF
jgi:hypothetical protein